MIKKILTRGILPVLVGALSMISIVGILVTIIYLVKAIVAYDIFFPILIISLFVMACWVIGSQTIDDIKWFYDRRKGEND